MLIIMLMNLTLMNNFQMLRSDEQSSEQIVQKNIENLNLDYKIFTTQFDEGDKS